MSLTRINDFTLKKFNTSSSSLVIPFIVILLGVLTFTILPVNVNACEEQDEWGNCYCSSDRGDGECPPDDWDDYDDLVCHPSGSAVDCRWTPNPPEDDPEETCETDPWLPECWQEPDPEYTLRVEKDGTGTGTVTSSPSGINCGSTCSQTSESRSRWDLTASPSSGSTFTRWSIGQYTYGGPPCITYGGKNNSCTQWTQIPTCGTVSQCRVDVPADSTSTVTATFAGPTLLGTLDVTPLSDSVGNPFTFTARRLATSTTSGAITYTNPRCYTGFLGLTTFSPVLGSYTGNTDNNFVCVYGSASNGMSNQNGARMTINQGGATRVVARNVTVTSSGTSTDFSVSLAASPTDGTVNATTFNFTPTAHNVGSHSVSYSNPVCGIGASPTNFSSSAGTFRCLYSTAGTKDASVLGTATRALSLTLTDTGSTTVTVTAAAPPPPLPVTASLSANPSSIIRPGSSTLRWESTNATSCAGSGFSTGNSTSGSAIVTPTSSRNYTVTCYGPGGPAFDTVSVNVSEPITGVTVTVDPTWVPRGGQTTVNWEILPPDAGNTATCTVASTNPGVLISPTGTRNYSSGQRSVNASNIQLSTRFTVTCTNDTNTRSGEATVYILPLYSEF
jgi:hypothetical protein